MKITLGKFCRIRVLNFEAYLHNHKIKEKEVQDYLRLLINTKEGKQTRRCILALEIWNGKLCENENLDSEKLPCAHCIRVIAANYSKRHYKISIVKPISGNWSKHTSSSTISNFSSLC